jgi:Flp pilus assembly protein TadD
MNALDKAEKAHRQALDVNAEDAIAHYNLGLVYAARGDEERALQAFAEAFSRDAKLRGFAATDDDTRAFRENAKFVALLSA